LFTFGNRTAALFRSDLKRAGIAARDEHGRVLDFHAMRHTTATRLAINGVPIKQAMAILRHKTIAMTAEVYGRLQRGDVRVARRSVPHLPLHPAVDGTQTTAEAG
jgi:integrase